MRKIIITAVLMLLSAGLYAQNEPDFVFEPEDISPASLTKLEKAEAELAHMQEKVDFYKKIVYHFNTEIEEHFDFLPSCSNLWYVSWNRQTKSCNSHTFVVQIVDWKFISTRS